MFFSGKKSTPSVRYQLLTSSSRILFWRLLPLLYCFPANMFFVLSVLNSLISMFILCKAGQQRQQGTSSQRSRRGCCQEERIGNPRSVRQGRQIGRKARTNEKPGTAGKGRQTKNLSFARQGSQWTEKTTIGECSALGGTGICQPTMVCFCRNYFILMTHEIKLLTLTN